MADEYMMLPATRPVTPSKRKSTIRRRERIMDDRNRGSGLKDSDLFNDVNYSTEQLTEEMMHRRYRMREYQHAHETKKCWQEESNLPYSMDPQFEANVLEFVVQQESLVIQDPHRARFHMEPEQLRSKAKRYRTRMRKRLREGWRDQRIAESEERSRERVAAIEAKAPVLKPTEEELRLKAARQRTKERDIKMAEQAKAKRIEEKEIAALAHVPEPIQFQDLRRKAELAEEAHVSLSHRDAYMLERMRIIHNEKVEKRLLWARAVKKRQKTEAIILRKKQLRQATSNKANSFAYQESEWALRLRRWSRKWNDMKDKSKESRNKLLSRKWRDAKWEDVEQEVDKLERGLRLRIKRSTGLPIRELKKRPRLSKKKRKRGPIRWLICFGWLWHLLIVVRFCGKNCAYPLWLKFKSRWDRVWAVIGPPIMERVAVVATKVKVAAMWLGMWLWVWQNHAFISLWCLCQAHTSPSTTAHRCAACHAPCSGAASLRQALQALRAKARAMTKEEMLQATFEISKSAAIASAKATAAAAATAKAMAAATAADVREGRMGDKLKATAAAAAADLKDARMSDRLKAKAAAAAADLKGLKERRLSRRLSRVSPVTSNGDEAGAADEDEEQGSDPSELAGQEPDGQRPCKPSEPGDGPVPEPELGATPVEEHDDAGAASDLHPARPSTSPAHLNAGSGALSGL